MERVTVRAIVMTWDPEARLAHITFAAPTRGTEMDAGTLVEALTRFVGKEGEPFGLLGDGGNVMHFEGGFRHTWARFFAPRKNEAFVAFYNQGPLLRVSADMYRLGTGVKLESFATEGEARAWLRKMGIRA